MCTPVNCSNRSRPFGPDGCQVPIGNGVCGEKRTLDFIYEFKKLYMRKMEEIDANGGGDCMQEKLRLQQEWIENLIEQNEMLVRAVGELEVEATERVHMLEEKLQRSAQCICEVMNKYRQYDVTNEILTEPLEKIFRLENDQKNLLEFIRRIRDDNKWDFEGLSFYEISYKDLFGNDLIENHYDKRFLNNSDEKEEQKAKNYESTIESLRKRIDFFNSFGNVEAIAKDLKCKTEECETLRQSMFDMRQALTEEVASKHDTILQLKKEVQQLEEKCIQADKQTAFRDDIVKELRKEIKQLKQQVTQDEVLKLHSTINELENNLQRTKQLQEEEEKLKSAEILKLNETVKNLMKKLKETEEKVKICKICKGRSKVGFSHSTEVQATLDQEQIEKQMELLQNREEIIKVQTDTLTLLQNEIENLKKREADMGLENEKQYNELNLMRHKVKEFEDELKTSEGKASNLQLADENKNLKNHLKKLQKQKSCYEEVVGYFRDEMNIMAEQLHNLQQLLTISHASIHEENDKLQKAFTNVQCVNQQLSCQLKAAEQKLLLENQMNQLNESKICELERLISDKELDLGRHDRAILSIRQTLQCSLKQNEDLHSTIVGLNATIANLQSAIIKYENDNSKSKENAITCQEQINACKAKLDELKQSLERKTAELCKLEMAYNNQNRSLKSAQMELKELKEKQREKQCHLKCIMGEMEDKLRISEEKYNKLMEEYKCLETKLGIIARRETIKQVEIQRYRQIVADLKKTLIDLNKNLTKKDYKPKCQNEICRRRYSNDNDEPDQDLPINCPCETEFYHTIVENLKKSVNDLQTKLNQTQRKNNELEAKCKCTEALVEEMSRSQIEKDKEYNELRQKLTEKLHLSQQEESRYLELAGQFERELGALRQKLEARTLQLNDVKNSAQEINSSRCMQLACAQEETNRLKEELNKLLRKHCNLNCENEKLHSQGAHLQSAVSNLEETNQLMKSQVEQYLLELQRVQTEKETLVQKNRELLAELRSLQVSHATVNKQQRELHIFHSTPKSQQPCMNNPACTRAVSPPMCQSPWSLGSQGTSYTPSQSPCLNEECDWYSSNFRSYSEDDEEEDDWVSKVEDLAAQVRKTNKMWKNKLNGPEFTVTKDTK